MTHPAPLTPDEKLAELVKECEIVSRMEKKATCPHWSVLAYEVADARGKNPFVGPKEFVEEIEANKHLVVNLRNLAPSLLALPALLQKMQIKIQEIYDHDGCGTGFESSYCSCANGMAQTALAELRAALSAMTEVRS